MKDMLRVILSLMMIMLLLPISLGQTQTVAKTNVCDPPEENCSGVGCEKRVPVIFGEPYLVPRLRIQLFDKNTSKPAAGATITLNYNWNFLEYPYTEAPFGSWSEASYSTTCSANEDGVIEVGEFKVEPHGWYKGIYSVGKKPGFLSVTVGYDLPYVGSKEKKCYTYTEISKSRLDKCRRSGRCEFPITDGCPPDWK